MKTLALIALILSFTNAYASGGGGSEAHGMPDLGYLACVGRGGKALEARTSQGKQSFCVLDDAFIATSTFYRAQEGQKSQAMTAFLASAAPAPSAACDAWGAKDETARLPHGSSLELCDFTDGSLISLETLRNGSLFEGNQKLRLACENQS